jgi:uncharacterized membrane protein
MPAAEVQGIVKRPAYIILFMTSTALTLGAVFYPLLAHIGFLKGAFVAKLCYAPICHQIPERSFSLFGYPLAICERCFAIYLAFMLYTWLYPFLRVDKLVRGKSLFIPAVLLTFLFLDWLLDAVGLVSNSLLSRTLSGFSGGLGIAYIAVPAWLQAMSSFTTRKNREPEIHA